MVSHGTDGAPQFGVNNTISLLSRCFPPIQIFYSTLTGLCVIVSSVLSPCKILPICQDQFKSHLHHDTILTLKALVGIHPGFSCNPKAPNCSFICSTKLWPPRMPMVLIPRNCDHVTSYGKRKFADTIKILIWENHPRLSSVIMIVLIKGQKEVSKGRSCYPPGFEDRGSGPGAKGCRWPLQARKGKERESLLGHPEGMPSEPISNFWPPEPYDNEFVSFEAIKCGNYVVLFLKFQEEANILYLAFMYYLPGTSLSFIIL